MNTDDIIKQGLCSIPWIHTEINLQANQVRPCCKYTGSFGQPADFSNIWHGQEYTKLRNRIAGGSLPQECSACAVADDVFSYKSYKNKIYKIQYNTPTEPVALPQVLNIILKNTCNLACRMCHPASSSKLHETAKRSAYLMDFYSYRDIDKRFDIENLRASFSNVKHITITGGEPLIDEDCYDLITMIKESAPGLRSIVFSTNMTRFNPRLLSALETLPKSIRIAFNISIDGPAAIHNYIRHGFNWDKLVDSIQQIKHIPNSIGINSTISAMNVGYLSEMIGDLRQLETDTGVKFTHIMSTPVLESHLHANCVPPVARAGYLEKLKAHTDFGINGSQALINTACDFLTQAQGNTGQMLKFLSEFDKVAGTDYTAVYLEWFK
jgi:sulfatase maturation enzyme AslB (radical SAM superfamily)